MPAEAPAAKPEETTQDQATHKPTVAFVCGRPHTGTCTRGTPASAASGDRSPSGAAEAGPSEAPAQGGYGSPVPISCGASRRAWGPSRTVRGQRGGDSPRPGSWNTSRPPSPRRTRSTRGTGGPGRPSLVTGGRGPGGSWGNLAPSSRGCYSQRGTRARGNPHPGAHVSGDKVRCPHPAPLLPL